MSSRRPTLDDVAALAGVSRMTVSNAYNRADQLSASTRLRVLEAAQSLGYPGPDPAARSLRRGRVGAVGVLLTERLPYAFTDPGLVQLLRGVATALSDAGQGLLLVPTIEGEGPALVRQSLVDAFILCSVPAGDPVVAAVQERRLPMVTVGSPKLRGVPFVGIDNEGEGRAVARHLIGLGHTRLLALDASSGEAGEPPRPGMRSRILGFVKECEKELGPGCVQQVEAESNDRFGGRTAIGPVLGRRRERPTAVFASTDVLALGVMDEAAARGLAVPGQLSVAGFDDIDAAARAVPALTTVRQRLTEQGRIATTLALAQVVGEAVKVPRLATQLVVRDSTGPVPGAGRTSR